NADLIADANASEGDCRVALEQQAGKGRQGRAWISPRGNFYGSTLVELGSNYSQPQALALDAGLALIEAIDASLPGQALMLKWPNALLLLGKKLAGILLERSGDLVVIRVGFNLAPAPELADRQCASLSGQLTSEAFALVLAESFERLARLWRQSEP